jgi:hypothetical protein
MKPNFLSQTRNRNYDPPKSRETLIAEALEKILDDEYAITETLIEFCDADHVESSLKGLVNAYWLKSDADLLVIAKGLAGYLGQEIKDRAKASVA